MIEIAAERPYADEPDAMMQHLHSRHCGNSWLTLSNEVRVMSTFRRHLFASEDCSSPAYSSAACAACHYISFYCNSQVEKI